MVELGTTLEEGGNRLGCLIDPLSIEYDFSLLECHVPLQNLYADNTLKRVSTTGYCGTNSNRGKASTDWSGLLPDEITLEHLAVVDKDIFTRYRTVLYGKEPHEVGNLFGLRPLTQQRLCEYLRVELLTIQDVRI